MDKDIFEIIVKRLTNSDNKTKQVMDIVFGNIPTIDNFVKCSNGHFYKKDLNTCNYCCEDLKIISDCSSKKFNTGGNSHLLICKNNHYYNPFLEEFCLICGETEKKEVVEYETVNSKPVDKKQEIMDSLCYLKSKEKKTNQDKESIYMLEMILRNMK